MAGISIRPISSRLNTVPSSKPSGTSSRASPLSLNTRQKATSAPASSAARRSVSYICGSAQSSPSQKPM